MNDETKKIKEHYEKSKKYSNLERERLSTITIRKFNNFIKSVLIKNNTKIDQSVLDIGCGKGGDIKKFANAGIYEYWGMDISESSIKEAESRCRRSNYRFRTKFFVQDCYNQPLGLEKQFDVISIQFSFHYAFFSKETLLISLKSIFDHLKEGGKVICTIPNPSALLRRFKNYGNNFGNEFYSVKFVNEFEKVNDKKFGEQYFFTLKDALEECVEYLIDFDLLESECLKMGLRIVEFTDFISYFNENVKKHLDLYNKMVGKKMTDKELAVPQLYSVLVIKKETN